MSRRIRELLVEERFEGAWEVWEGGAWGGKVTQVCPESALQSTSQRPMVREDAASNGT